MNMRECRASEGRSEGVVVCVSLSECVRDHIHCNSKVSFWATGQLKRSRGGKYLTSVDKWTKPNSL